MIDYFIVLLLTAMWLCSVIGAFAVGWNTGWDKCNKHHRWSKWLIKREEQRNIRI